MFLSDNRECMILDPPGPGCIGDRYFHAWCPSVIQIQKQAKTPCKTKLGSLN